MDPHLIERGSGDYSRRRYDLNGVERPASPIRSHRGTSYRREFDRDDDRDDDRESVSRYANSAHSDYQRDASGSEVGYDSDRYASTQEPIESDRGYDSEEHLPPSDFSRAQHRDDDDRHPRPSSERDQILYDDWPRVRGHFNTSARHHETNEAFQVDHGAAMIPYHAEPTASNLGNADFERASSNHRPPNSHMQTQEPVADADRRRRLGNASTVPGGPCIAPRYGPNGQRILMPGGLHRNQDPPASSSGNRRSATRRSHRHSRR